MAPQAPPGYRLLQPQEAAVGKDVLYISQDPTKSHMHTQILDITINGDKIKLKHQSGAHMNRVFVTDKAAAGAEETGLFTATGAEGSAGAASASATLGEAASPGKAVADADADKSLRNEVVCLMYSLEAVGASLPEALEAVLAALGKTPEALVQAFKAVVPWIPCVIFQAVPRTTTQ